jgi:hypothetical protein
MRQWKSCKGFNVVLTEALTGWEMLEISGGVDRRVWNT